MDGYRSAVKCLCIQPGERVLVLGDTLSDRTMLERMREAAGRIGKAELVIMEPTYVHGREPPKMIADLMKEFDAEFLMTTYSLTHTKARQEASDAGARIASMPGVTREIMEEGAMLADYSKVSELTRKMAEALEGADRIRITSPAGTDVEFRISGREIHLDTGMFCEPGSYGNLPAGEVFVAPIGGEGRIVFDFFEREMGVEAEIREGRAVKTNSSLLNEVMKRHGNAGVLAEFGIGTNPRARVTGNILEDEKVLGTVHLAFGNNIHFGGENDVPFHQDGIILKPTVQVDGRIIIEEGRWRV